VPSQRFLEASLDDLNATYPGKVDRQIMVIEALRNVAELRGAVVELGVYRGHTAIHLAKTMQDLGDTSRLYLFDSFQGLPENEGVWKQGDLLADPDEVTRRFQQFPHVTIVPGLFAETLPNLPQMPVKLAHVDADLYHSTKDANGWLLDRVVPGGIIIIYDDYGFSTTPGVKQAVDEDFKPRSDYHRFYLPTGQLLAIKVPPP
jgi:O-methyltransferase